jgi:hypothetical protein
MGGVRVTCAVVMACLACGVLPAAADTIVVTPAAPRPGQRVHIRVPDCGTGPTAHTAASTAFTGDVTLYGKADTGDADPMLRHDLKPGTYPITAHCGPNRTVRGQLAIGPGDRPSAGHEQQGSHTVDWLLAAAAIAIAAIAAVFLLRKRED